MSGNCENNRKRSVSKAMALVIAFVLTVGISITGTLAWLTAQSETVTNTFTSAKLFEDPTTQFTLWEHEATDDNKDGRYELTTNVVTSNTYDILPGVNIPKDPTVDVKKLEEHAYLYIMVTNGLPNELKDSYTIDSDNWELLTGYIDVWVYKGTEADANHVIKASDDSDSTKKTFTVNVLTQNQQDGTSITVPSDYSGTANGSTLVFNAYMAQATGNGDDAVGAWVNTFNLGTKTTP